METVTVTPPPKPGTEFVTLPELSAISEAEGWGLTYRNFRAFYLTGRLPVVKFGNRPKARLSMVREMLADTGSALYK